MTTKSKANIIFVTSLVHRLAISLLISPVRITIHVYGYQMKLEYQLEHNCYSLLTFLAIPSFVQWVLHSDIIIQEPN